MARGIHRLSDRQCAAIKRPGLYSDGAGLYVQVAKVKRGLSRSWIFRFSRDGKTRKMGLGPLHDITLAEARDAARECRRVLRRGDDPINVRRKALADKRSQATTATFEQCAKRYIAAHQDTWRNPRHRAQWESTLAAYAFPVLGKLPIASIETDHVLRVLEPIWTAKAETANRVRGRIETVIHWAKARGMREAANPATWSGHLDQLLPRRSKFERVRHHPALPYSDVPAFMSALRARNGVSSAALEFTALTAARTGAVIGATWSEVDFGARVWTVPADRQGAKIVGDDRRARRVPLSNRAIQILKEICPDEATGDRPIFINPLTGVALSNMAMLELMRDLRPGYVPHGLRSSFKDWAAEMTNFGNEVSEAALWHVVADKVEAAYRRGELFEKRRRLMEAWGNFCQHGGSSNAAEVIALHA